jgi:hypothetical protein
MSSGIMSPIINNEMFDDDFDLDNDNQFDNQERIHLFLRGDGKSDIDKVDMQLKFANNNCAPEEKYYYEEFSDIPYEIWNIIDEIFQRLDLGCIPSEGSMSVVTRKEVNIDERTTIRETHVNLKGCVWDNSILENTPRKFSICLTTYQRHEGYEELLSDLAERQDDYEEKAKIYHDLSVENDLAITFRGEKLELSAWRNQDYFVEQEDEKQLSIGHLFNDTPRFLPKSKVEELLQILIEVLR